MSRKDGTSSSTKQVNDSRKPYVVEVFDPRNIAFKPVRGGRFQTLALAVGYTLQLVRAGLTPDSRYHIIEFGSDGKPEVVWES